MGKKTSETRRRMIGAGIAAVLIAVVVAGFLALSSRDTTGEVGAAPAGVTDGYAVTVGDKSATTTLTFYEDPQCPICAAFEGEVADDVAEAVAAGRVKVEYRVVSFLDHASLNDYSSRAANALMVVQNAAGEEAFAEMHRVLYENQPAEGTAGPDDDQLVAWAVAAGADESDVREGIESGRYDQFIQNATDQMSQDGVNGTPTVLVDGDPVGGSPAAAVAAVEDIVA